MTGFAVDGPRGGAETSEMDDPAHGHGSEAHTHGDEMRSVDEVRASILQGVHSLAPIELHLQEAFGCVLAKDVVAELDIPAFSSSAMDGFAVRASDVAAATVDDSVTLRIVGRAMVGRPPDATVGGGEAVRIATGAPDPVLSDLDRSDYDQLWLFAVDTGDGLDPKDCAGISRFRKKGRGMLVTRDHMDLGSSV